MHKNLKRAAVTAASVVLVVSFSLTSYGQGAYRIVKEVLLGEGNAVYIESEATGNVEEMSIPDYLSGQLFDEEGHTLTHIPREDPIYNAQGEMVRLRSSQSNPERLEIITTAESRMELVANQTVVGSLAEALPYLTFDLKAPTQLPAGYSVDQFVIYNGGAPAQKDVKIADMYISNGDIERDIFIQARFMDEETGFATGFGEIIEGTINGYPAVFSDDGRYIAFELDGVLYTISAGIANVSASELLRLAESI